MSSSGFKRGFGLSGIFNEHIKGENGNFEWGKGIDGRQGIPRSPFVPKRLLISSMSSAYTFSLQCSPLFSFFQSFFSLSSLSSPAKDFPSHNSLSSFLSSPAPPAALPNGPRLSPNPSLPPCTQLFLTTAQSIAVFFAPSSLWCRAGSEQTAKWATPELLTDVAKEAHLNKCKMGMAPPGSRLEKRQQQGGRADLQILTSASVEELEA